jgi:hypothetical protein
MKNSAFGCTMFVAVCLLSLGCGSSDTASSKGSSSSTSRTSVSTSPRNEGPPIYGDYQRPEFGLVKKPALRFHADVWYVLFPEPGAWSGVVEIGYAGRKAAVGHAYAYTANRRMVRLGAETQRAGLKRGGFACQHDGPAVYGWTRSDDYTILRFTAIQEPCAIRRTILEAEWRFVD